MKRAVVFAFIVCCAVSALSLAEDGTNFVTAATVSPADELSTPSSVTQTTPKATTSKLTTPAPTTPKATTSKLTTTIPITANTTTPTTPTPTTANTTTPTPTTANTTTPTTANTTTPTPTTANTTTPTPTTANTTTPTPTTANTTTPTTANTTTPTTANTTTPTTATPTTANTTTPNPTTPPLPQPTPSTNLTVGKYNVTKDKKVCLMAQMALQIRLATPKANGTFIVQPSLTTADGICMETTANLTLFFKEGFIAFMFNKSTADNTVFVDALSFNLAYPLTKDGNIPYAASNKSLHCFAAKVGHSYSCKSESLYMGNGLYLDVNQDQMQAFNLTKSNEFGLPDPCAADKPDYRVAIAVGVTLLVLIVVVLVAYLLSRRRQTSGYQSL